MPFYLIQRADNGHEEIAETATKPGLRGYGGDCTFVSAAYQTADELRTDRGVLLEPCRECGGVVSTKFMEPIAARLGKTNLCFHCDHWTQIHLNASRHVFVDGQCYAIGKEQPRGYQGRNLGFGGAEFKIRFRDGREVVTHNLWTQGEVPDHFRERLPDTAEFVKPEPSNAR